MSADSPSRSWFNRTVIGAGLTSLLADVAYEAANSLLAGFLVVLGIPQWFLGVVEGTGDAIANFVKLGIGYYSDRIGKRKTIVVTGYALTGLAMALFALAIGWPLILLGKSIAWIGKGLRGPLRDAILADSVPPEAVGRAFGFHRAGDTVGAIIGPLFAAYLLGYFAIDAIDAIAPYRSVFFLAMIPGLGSAVVFLLMVREQRFTPRPALRFRESLSELPRPFRRYLVAVGIFGLGDFSHVLLIGASILLLEPHHGLKFALVAGPILYAVRNGFQAMTAFPVGALSDRIGRRGLLVCGYLLGVTAMLGFAAGFVWNLGTLAYVIGLFALAGVYVGIQEALEGAMTADLIPDRTRRGTAYGLLGCVNGIGDFAASVVVGVLIMWRAEFAFVYAAMWMFLGAIAMMSVNTRKPEAA